MTWSGLSLLSAVAGRKIWTMHGDMFTIYPNIYVCMVGTPGSGKSTAMEQAEDIFIKHFADYFVSESIQSREDILKKMTNPGCIRTLKKNASEFYEWAPFYCIVDEMENFLGVDDKKMIATLVGIFSRSSFGTGFKNDANPNQRIKHPYFSMLACTVPEWLMNNLRQSLFSGGLGRRLILVHCTKDKEIPNPMKPVGYDDAMKRVVTHLKIVEQHHGCLVKTPDAIKWWKDWYTNPKRKNIEDPILSQFDETEHIMGLKVATLLALAEKPNALTIETEHLEFAFHLLGKLKIGIARLTSGIGRNELAGVGAQVIDHIQRMGGMVPEIQLKKFFNRYLNMPEFKEVLQHFSETGELTVAKAVINGVEKFIYFTPERFASYLEEQKKHRAATNAATQPSPVSGQAQGAGQAVPEVNLSTYTPPTSGKP